MLFTNIFMMTLIVVFNWNHFEMRFLNLRINFLFIADFYSHLDCFFLRRPEVKFGRNIVKEETTQKHKNYQDENKSLQ